MVEVDVVALIMAVSGLVTAVSVLVSKFYKNKIVESLTQTDEWVAELEAKGAVTAGVEVFTELSPEARKYLEDHKEEIARFKAEIEAKTATVKKASDVVDKVKEQI